MKPLPFLIPKSSSKSIHLQVDKQAYLYDYLHQHEETQITLIKKGEGQLIVGDFVGRFKPGDVYLIGSNIPHVFKNDRAYYQNVPSLYAHAISVYFTWNTFGLELWKLPEFSSLYHNRGKLSGGLKIKESIQQQIGSQIEKLWEVEGIQRICQLFLLLEKLISIADYQMLTQNINVSLNAAQGKRLDEIYRFTLNNYHRPIQLEELAALSCLTVSSFCRYFKKRTRKSYFEFLAEIRISHARQLLIKENDLSIYQIAYQVGFQNLGHFNRQFKALTQLTPSAYRKRGLLEDLKE